MFKKFYPHAYADSVFSINYEKLYSLGFKGIIFDIDNTLVHHGDGSTPEVDKLFDDLKTIGFTTLLLSNNDESRVKRFIRNIDSLYICDANKPDTAGYIRAIDMMNLSKKEIIYIGDQIFTDILGANKCEIASILVKFIRLPSETKIGKKRHLENVILRFYRKNKTYYNRLKL